MRKIARKNPKKVGTAPGTLIHVGKKLKDNVDIFLLEYNEQMSKMNNINTKDISINKDKDKVHWLNIVGIHDTEFIAEVGKAYNLHKLLIEDILNTCQRIKVDDYGNYIYIVLNLLSYYNDTKELESTQLSLVFMENTVISFLENDSDVFDNIITRITSDKGTMRKYGADYLLYALIDAVVDNYSLMLEKLGDKLDAVEDKLVDDPEKEVLQNIYELKREMLFVRNSIWPARNVMDTLMHFCDSYFSQNIGVYFRDVYDHIMRTIDTTEIYRDMLSNMLDTYLSSISNKTNDVMKVLTIISVIFMPITCLAGIYGMNFDFMPELRLHWGYALFWILAAGVTLFMITYF
ncbi:MAG: magnesium/cobalt transporter CorA, partial [Bacillota bacterium]|nr:magnesium/cobalt transporter CorA [Bacillota bacterium]